MSFTAITIKLSKEKDKELEMVLKDKDGNTVVLSNKTVRDVARYSKEAMQINQEYPIVEKVR